MHCSLIMKLKIIRKSLKRQFWPQIHVQDALKQKMSFVAQVVHTTIVILYSYEDFSRIFWKPREDTAILTMDSDLMHEYNGIGDLVGWLWHILFNLPMNRGLVHIYWITSGDCNFRTVVLQIQVPLLFLIYFLRIIIQQSFHLTGTTIP